MKDPDRKVIALVLSGGGAKGAFQVAVERYARERKGYHWDIIAGVSVGALNGTMLAMEKYERLYEIWNTISNDQVYTGGFNIWSVIKLLFGAKSFYGNEPLRRRLNEEFEPEKILADLRVGAVSLLGGEYVQFTKASPYLREAVLASTVMPIIWEPLDISPQHPAMIDGGVRNISPIGDVLDLDPDEIVIINCAPEKPERLAAPPGNILQIGLRTLDLLLNELFISDLREFLHLNDFVLQANAHGHCLLHPTHARPLKHYPCKVINPDIPLGDTLDFSQQAIQLRFQAGWRCARQVFG